MKHKSYMLIFLLLFVFIFSSAVYAAKEYISLTLNYDGKTHQYTEEKVILKVNGKEMNNLTMPPIIFDDYTVVPAREVFEEVGAKVSWNKDTYEVTIDYNSKKVVIKIGSKTANVNGVSMVMNIPAKIINNKTMIPLRFVSSSVGLEVLWDSKTRVASVTGGGNTVDFTDITSISVPSEYSNGKFIINADKAITKMKPVFMTENRLVVDVYDAKIKLFSNNIEVSNFAVLRVRSGQNDSVARIVFDLKKDFNYDVIMAKDKKSIIVTFENNGETESTTENIIKETTETTTDAPIVNNTNSTEIPSDSSILGNIVNSSIEGIYYNNFNTSLVISKNGGNFDLSNIEHIDDYNNGIYKVVFAGDYTKFVNSGIVSVNDHNFGNIQIDVTKNSFSVTFYEKSILAFDVLEDSENIYINAMKPKSKYKNIVVLDAGHGGHDSGATSNGYVEKSITLDIVNRILGLLEKDDNIKGYGTRTTDVYPSFDDRNKLGNQVGDMFISVHINSASSQKANGTEVYYHDTKNVALSRGISSSLLASTLHKNLLEKLESFDRKVKREDFIVLRQSPVPATLCEIGFITNADEGAKLNSPEYRQLAAEAIYQSIKELFEKYPNR